MQSLLTPFLPVLGPSRILSKAGCFLFHCHVLCRIPIKFSNQSVSHVSNSKIRKIMSLLAIFLNISVQGGLALKAIIQSMNVRPTAATAGMRMA